MDDVILGLYVPGASAVHRLDPRTKLALCAALVLLVFAVHGWWGYALYFAFAIGLTVLGQIPWGFLLRGMKPMFYFALLTLIFQLIFVGDGNDLWRWHFLRVTDYAVVSGVYMCLRLLLVVHLVLLLTLTTSPLEISEGIEKLFRPFGRLGLNSYEVALVASGALRFVPTLLEQADKVKRAQMARGVNFEEGNIIVRTRKMLPLLAPLFINAIRRAEDLGMAMEARCFQGGKGRVARRETHMGVLDALAWGTSAVLAAVLIGFRL